MALQVLAVHELEGRDMRRFQDHRRGSIGFERFLPTLRAQAPTITSHKTRKMILRARGGEVVAGLLRELEELFCHHNTHGVHTPVSRSHPAMTIPPEPGQGVHPAGLQRIAQDITLFAHGQGFAEVAVVFKR